MRQEKIKPLFFAQSIFPLTRTRKTVAPTLIGFDSEYTSDWKHEIVCLQLSSEKNTIVFPEKRLTWERLTAYVKRCLGRDFVREETIYLPVFWATAELQHLPADNVIYQEWRAGAYDATYRGKVTLKVIDLAQWFDHTSLQKAAKLFGLKKIKYDCSNITRKNLKDPAFLTYARNDAEITRKIFIALRESILKLFNADMLVYRTPASASMSAFRRKHVKEKLHNPDMRIRRQALLSMHGGALQSYFRGERKGKGYLYDAPSQYPQAVLAIGKFPNAGHC